MQNYFLQKKFLYEGFNVRKRIKYEGYPYSTKAELILMFHRFHSLVLQGPSLLYNKATKGRQTFWDQN